MFVSSTILLLHPLSSSPCTVSLHVLDRAAVLPHSALTPPVLEGSSVRVIEEDDGSGWVKVVDEDGDRGLVPASYIEAADATQAASPGIAHLGSGQFGEWPHDLGFVSRRSYY